MLVPLDFTALRTAPVEESVWPKSPATPNENVEVAADGGLPEGSSSAGHPRGQADDGQRHQADDRQAEPDEPRLVPAAGGAHDAHVHVIGRRDPARRS